MRGLSLWIIIGMLFYALLTAKPKNQHIILLVTIFFDSGWRILHGWLMHYFQVSDKILLVRNHIFFWKRKAYLVDDIAEFTFETRGKMPYCLRVITKDYKSKIYPAGTLRLHTCLKLKDRLRSIRKKVRDECIY